MELQLFDSKETLRRPINLAEPLWPLVRESLRAASLMSGTADTLDQDLDVDRARLESLLGFLAPVLRQHQARVSTKGHVTGYDEVSVVVLGETMRVNARNPEHGILMRLNSLHTSLTKIFESGLRLQVPARSVTEEEMKSNLRRHAEALFDERVIDDSIVFLETWLLAPADCDRNSSTYRETANHPVVRDDSAVGTGSGYPGTPSAASEYE